jgi:dTMP kinase
VRPDLPAIACHRLALRPHGHPGALVTFCGVDGAGKSTIIDHLQRVCRDAGVGCLRTATPTRRIRDDVVFRTMIDDPGSTGPGAGEGGARPVSILGILLFIMGDLVQHTTETILPALARGEVVLCDRYVSTSHAEIVARADPAETEPMLARIAEHLPAPDLAFGLDVSVETSHSRVIARNDASDRPPPLPFLRRQIAAYRAVFAANQLTTLDTERDISETLAAARRELLRLRPLAPAVTPERMRNAR